MMINKKIIIFTIAFFILIFISVFLYVIINKTLENNDQSLVFKVNKISLYSSSAITDNSENGLLENLDIHQFTDIAIYIDNTSYIKDLTPKNTIKELSIYNIKLDTNSTSDTGKVFLAYKNPLLYGKFEQLLSATEKINFRIIKSNDENVNANYNSPVFYTDCSNPISLGYLNLGIVKNYNITEKIKNVSFDGNILKQADINIQDLKCTLSFTIKIKNNLGEEFVCDISFNNIAGDSSIYSGQYIKEFNSESLYNFSKI